MTTDLFYTPTLPQKPPSSFQRDKAGSASPDPFSKTKSPGSSKASKHENFLTSLRKASRDRNRSEGSRQPAPADRDRSEKTDRHLKNKHGVDPESTGDDTLNVKLSVPGDDGASQDDQMPVTAELKEIIALLEKLGLMGSSGERMLLSGAEWAGENMSNPAGKALDSLAAFKQMLGAIQSNDLGLGSDMKTGLDRLQQFIAKALAVDSSVPNPNDPKNGFNLNQLLGQENTTRIMGALTGEGTGGEKPVDILSAGTQPSAKAVENSQISLQSESVEKTDASKLTPDMRGAAEANAATKDIKIQELVPGEAGDSKRIADFSRSLAAADKGPRSGGEPPMENSLTGESSPVSKLINDAQVEKDNPLKGNITPGDEAGTRVVKLEAGTNDSGQLTSQSQTFDKTLESASAAKEAEAAQRELRSDTMGQIVRRAVIQIRDGQHEARIDLKPDFMGHVRMQVITENQQVTVKILTEFGFVKDMIENNIQQLKADLQQQGLEVDKVDVSVSRDSQGNKHQQENAEHAKNPHREEKSSDRDNDREGQHERPDRSPLRAEGLSTVDYFA
jgi:flagellar hook-length control protein FliK